MLFLCSFIIFRCVPYVSIVIILSISIDWLCAFVYQFMVMEFHFYIYFQSFHCSIFFHKNHKYTYNKYLHSGTRNSINKNMTRKKTGKKNKSDSAVGRTKEGETWLRIDPDRIRFQHSRIRPFFSGCGRGVQETLDQIRDKQISASDLPHIQVIVGKDDDENTSDEKGPWYFGLNNRRLWVLKKCKEEGLLPDADQLILVRARGPKSYDEEERYTIKNCALQAKFMREPKRKNKNGTRDTPKEETQESSIDDNHSPELSKINDKLENLELDIKDKKESLGQDENERLKPEDESSDDENQTTTNPFSALM